MAGRTGALLVDALLARLVVLACVALAVGALLLPPRAAAGGVAGEAADRPCAEAAARAPGEPIVWISR